MQVSFHQDREAIYIQLKGKMADSDRRILLSETQNIIAELTLPRPLYCQLSHFHLNEQNLICLHKIYTLCQQARCPVYFVTKERQQLQQLKDRGLPVHQDTPTQSVSPLFY